jgi:ribonuclease inhibitor
MKEYRLEGEKMTDPDRTQAHIKHRLEFPDYYGENLDALWDELTAFTEPTSITLYDSSLMLNQLGQYGYDLLDTFEDAARTNHNVLFESY